MLLFTFQKSQEHLNTRVNNLYVEGFDDYVITEIINMLCKNQCFLFVHNFAYFSLFLWKPVFSKKPI